MSESPILDHLRRIHEQFLPLRSGKVADYIPELTKADPEWFGVAMMTRDGHLYEVGDSRQHFTIQSISKALTYGLALEARGETEVLRRIGVEPSGDAFNAISLKPLSGAPMNPMINAGAIAACGLVPGQTADEKISRILETFSLYAGRPLDIDEEVYQSESRTGHRNRAIGWMLRNFGILDSDPTETLEAYFRQCSIRVTGADLAMIGATLANKGVNPATGKRAVAPELIDNILSVMSSCGMYDYSGEWIYQVGLPAKSGVGGGILAVLPGQFGFGVFSPRLDDQGNSVRGIAVCGELSRTMGLHMLNVPASPMTTIRCAFDRRSVASNRRRPDEQSERLRLAGARIRGYHLQGSLTYGMAEPLVRDISARAAEADFFIANLRAALHIDPAAARLLADTHRGLSTAGKRMIFSEAGALREALSAAGIPDDAFFPDNDRAIEQCEDELLNDAPKNGSALSGRLPLADCLLCDGLEPGELARLDAILTTRAYPAGSLVLRRGDGADELLILARGSAIVSIPTQGGAKRLDVFGAGMHFGEVAFLDSSVRSADVVADGDIECRVLTREAFERLAETDPLIKIKLMQNIARGLTRTLRRITLQLEALA